jgi:hypothetical protein
MSELIIDCPVYGHEKYLINTVVPLHVQEKAINDILKYFSPEATIDIKKVC